MKRIISMLTAIVMIISLLPVVSSAMEYVVYKDFEDYELGEAEISTSDCSVGGDGGAAFKIACPPGSENKAIHIVNDGRESEKSVAANVVLRINRSGKITVEFKILLTDNTQTTFGLESKVYGWKSFLIMQNGTVKPYTGNPVATLSEYAQSYVLNEWYTVKLAVDTETEKYDWYLNNKLIAEGIKLPGPEGFFKDYGIYRGQLQRYIGKGNYSEAYVDDIRVFAGEGEIKPSKIAEEGEEGLYLKWQPEDNFLTYRNPPIFTWPSIPMAEKYTLQLSRNKDMSDIVYEFQTDGSYYSPSHTMDSGVWYWRVNGKNMNGTTEWSKVKRFRIATGAVEHIIPEAEKMAEMVSKTHPRLWFNDETLPEYREAVAEGEAKKAFDKVKAAVDGKLKDTVAEEPELIYPEGATGAQKSAITNSFKSEVTALITDMYQTAYVYMITGEAVYKEKAIAYLDDIAGWDPHGNTSYKSLDTANKIIIEKGSIVYDWLYNELSEETRAKVLSMIKERFYEMYKPLMQQHPLDEFPYDSHGTTCMTTLFGVCFAIMHDIPEAEGWFKRIQPVFYKIYGYGGEDGGYSGGTGYANFEIAANAHARHDMVYTATGYEAWKSAEQRNKPDYLMYFMSNGAPVGSFGDDDLIAPVNESVSLIRYLTLAEKYNSGALKWASETRGNTPSVIEPMLLKYFSNDIESVPPFDYLNSYHDRDIGWIAMKSDLIDPQHTAVHFKSSWWGSYNHSHADQNSFFIYAYGEPLALDSGYFDYYYSDHDENYTRQTLAHNAITVNGGKGQYISQADPEGNINAKGDITGYLHGEKFNLASGNAEKAYPDLDKADRYLIYLKPDYVIVVDELSAVDDKPTQFEFNLKAISDFELLKDEQKAIITQGRAKLSTTLQYPRAVEIEDFDTFIGIDGLEHRPSEDRLPRRKDHYGIRFDTEKTSDTVMVTTLDILKSDEEEKNVLVNKNDECMEITVEGNKKVYVRLDYTKDEVSYGDVTFKGTAAVFEDDSFMLVNGTELKKGGETLILCDIPTDVSYETGELHVFGNSDGKVSVKLPFKVTNIKDENGFETVRADLSGYDYGTMAYKWTQSDDNIINIDFEAGQYNMYLNETPVMKYDGLTVRINGRVVKYKAPPFIENGTLYVPLVETVKMYGCHATNLVSSYKITKSRESYGDYTIRDRTNRIMWVYPNSTKALLNNIGVTLGKPTIEKDGIFYIPFKEYYEVFTDRIGYSEYANTYWVYTEPIYQDDVSSTVYPVSEKMTEEEYEEYLLKKKINIIMEGKGRVEYDADNLETGKEMTFKIIPDDGYYISRVIFNGTEMTNLDPSEVTVYTKELPEKSTLEIIFGDYFENPDDINAFSTPYMFFYEKDAYYFGKVFTSLIPDEYGILWSRNPDPVDKESDTKRVKSEYLPNLNGYFGIRLVNKTGDKNLKIYIRPYVVYNGILNSGECHYVDFETVKDPPDTSTLSGWIEYNKLDNAGIMKATLTE
ncbi:MAG: DUF4962 domain-containing protein [Ruminococcaceae bacterium]|nr:DUF4962 domain-containing protein [Oscillospiraceae bacterium]